MPPQPVQPATLAQLAAPALPVQHYCSTCKRLVPLAAGIAQRKPFTIGAAHVQTPPSAELIERGAMTPPCSWQHRTYHRDEQDTNLEELLSNAEAWL